MPFDFADLRRRPDFEAPNLVAVDATDRLLLDEAATSLAGLAPGELVTVGDHYGALTLGAAHLHGLTGIRVFQDPLVGELALAANAAEAGLSDVPRSLPLSPELFAGARVVLLQLPRSLAALDEIVGLIATHAHPEVVVYAGGRLKHMTIGMNDVLREHFSVVYAGLARQKSRVLTASETVDPPVESPWPRTQRHDELGVGAGLAVAAFGGTFAGSKIDIGTRALLEVLPQASPAAEVIVDLGCGSGVLAVSAALARPAARVIASDQSASAVASTAATAELNGVANRVTVVRDDALSSQAPGSCDLVLLNPPFHVDAAVEPGVALKLFEAASRVLRPGGELWTVYNSHLKHRDTLAAVVGETRQVTRNPKFTVTVSVKA